MSTWVIISWVVVALLTAGNIFFFLKLKKASEQMIQMAFPGAKNMNDALSRMQNMMKGAQRGNPFAHKGMARRGKGKGPKMDPQLQQAMAMLQQMQGRKK